VQGGNDTAHDQFWTAYFEKHPENAPKTAAGAK
jgi:hypothetical protein